METNYYIGSTRYKFWNGVSWTREKTRAKMYTEIEAKNQARSMCEQVFILKRSEKAELNLV